MTTTAKDKRLGNAQVPKSAMQLATSLGTKLDFSAKYIYSAALQAFSQLDTRTQVEFVRDAHARYAEAGGGGSEPAPAPSGAIPADSIPTPVGGQNLATPTTA